MSLEEFKSEHNNLIRNKCIICECDVLNKICVLEQFPIMTISNNSVEDKFFDFTLVTCKNCNCLQLKYLIDPNILYSDVYTLSVFSQSWADHFNKFGQFILENTNETLLLEIGANKGDLYKIISKSRDIEYVTLDMFKSKDLPEEIKFIEGNCETYTFNGYKTIILSHVFEHLYYPMEFIKNIKCGNVEEVFISIPNFDLLLKEGSLNLINSQHTFYCGLDYIIYMFSLFNYKCEKYIFYEGAVKSVMFKFVIVNSIKKINLPTTEISLYNNIYKNKIYEIKNIEVPKNSYIFPSGIYGQFYYYLLSNKENIIGFLDNNKNRFNNKLFGTSKLVFDPETIDYENSTILICECSYKEEIVNKLKNLYPNINLLFLI